MRGAGAEAMRPRVAPWRREARPQMNVVDIGILVVIGVFAVGGLRRGFLLGVFDLIAFGLAIVVAARMTPSLAGPLHERGIAEPLASGAAFLVAAVASLAIIGLAGRILLAPLGALASGTPLGWANGVLGLLPGAVRGVLSAAVLLIVLSAVPPEFGVRRALAGSELAGPIGNVGRDALVSGLGWAGVDLHGLEALMQPAGPVARPAGSGIPFATVAHVAIVDAVRRSVYAD